MIGEPAADRGRIALPQAGQLVEQRCGEERLIVLDGVADPAGDRGGDRRAGAVALGAGGEQPQRVDRLLAVAVVAQLDPGVGPRRVKARGGAAAAPEAGGRGAGGDRGGEHGEAAGHHEQASIVVTLR